MNVLEKILEEIEHLKEAFDCDICKRRFSKDRDCYVNCDEEMTEEIIEIIRSHMNHNGDDAEMDDWIPVDSDNQPKDEERVLVSFENFNEVLTARYKAEEEGGTFLLDADDTDESFVSHDLYVSAWQPLPDRYKGE